MAVGTRAGLLDGPQPQSVFKHGILDQHAIRFATMTASRLPGKRAVLVDGFAGRGRFDTGQAASAELMMIAAQKMKKSTQIDIFLVEKNKKDFKVLDRVADEYRSRGINIETRLGECGDHLEDAFNWAKGASLFLFLDPCGAMLPFDLVHDLVKKRGNWPRTEVLMNFNAGLIRRAGGQYAKGQLDLGGVAAADLVCGGEWWRNVAIDAHRDSGGKDWEASADAVALEYARRLARGTDKGFVVAPVRREPHHQPIYHLVFLTADPHGHWVFGHAASVAREKWLQAIGPDEDAETGMLFDMRAIDDQIATEKARAERIIADNIRELVADGQPKSVVKHTIDIFGDAYGEARETTFSAVLRGLVKSGEVVIVEKGAKPYKHVIQKA